MACKSVIYTFIHLSPFIFSKTQYSLYPNADRSRQPWNKAWRNSEINAATSRLWKLPNSSVRPCLWSADWSRSGGGWWLSDDSICLMLMFDSVGTRGYICVPHNLTESIFSVSFINLPPLKMGRTNTTNTHCALCIAPSVKRRKVLRKLQGGHSRKAISEERAGGSIFVIKLRCMHGDFMS